MAECYLGEIRIFAGNYAPENWHICDGTLLSISQYNALFSLIGTTYGGDGKTNFALPDLRGRLPVHMGQGVGLANYKLGSMAGTETVTLTSAQLAIHTHPFNVSRNSATTPTPGPALVYGSPAAGWGMYDPQSANSGEQLTPLPFGPQELSSAGGSGAHDNMMPCLVINFIIALLGDWPTPPN